MIDLITVVFNKELPYLELQAKSIEQYVNSSDINSIVVVVNDHTSIVDQVNPLWYGKLADKIQIKHYTYYIKEHSEIGWDNQQLYKLLAAGKSKCEWSVILDAKTLFIKNYNLTDIIKDNKVNLYAVPCPACFYTELKFIENLFNVNFYNSILSCGAPFYFHTATVQSLINHIEKFDRFFIDHASNPPRVTEFILYSGYVLYKFGSYDVLYQLISHNKYSYKPCNISDWEWQEFNEIMQKIHFNMESILTVSLHRRAYVKLTSDQQTQWLELLQTKNIVSDIQNIKSKLNILY
jgi:hypothetical protein